MHSRTLALAVVWGLQGFVASPAFSSEPVDKIPRSAGFQPAVSPISNRLTVEIPSTPELSHNPQAGSPAIQQVGNLRYEFVTGSVSPPVDAATIYEVAYAHLDTQ